MENSLMASVSPSKYFSQIYLRRLAKRGLLSNVAEVSTANSAARSLALRPGSTWSGRGIAPRVVIPHTSRYFVVADPALAVSSDSAIQVQFLSPGILARVHLQNIYLPRTPCNVRYVTVTKTGR